MNSRTMNFSRMSGGPTGGGRRAPGALLAILLAGALLFCGEPDSKRRAPEEKLPEYAVIRGENVSVRIDPLPTASEVEFLDRGARVRVKKRGVRRARVAGYNDYWYLVELDSGIRGWVYGAQLSLTRDQASAGGKKETEPEMTAAALRREVLGKWWEIRSDGSTGYRKLYFWPDGKYKYGYGSGRMNEGKYEILPASRAILLDKISGVGEKLIMKKVGRDFRLYAEKKDRTYAFRRGDTDPESKEVGLEEKNKNKKKN